MTWTPRQTPFPYVLVSDQVSGAAKGCDPPAWDVESPQGILYIPIPREGELLSAGLWPHHFAPDEATQPGLVSVCNLDGCFFVAIPQTDAMAPDYPAGSFVAFQDAAEREPMDGDAVYVSLATRPAMYTRLWWQFWKPLPSDKANCFTYSLCIRHFTVGKDGRVTLAPVDGRSKSWTEGIHKGVETRMRILGIATGHKPRGYLVSMVQC